MKIQLINPPLLVNPWALTALRPSPPLGLAYIAAALLKTGHEVSVLDAVAEAPDRYTPVGQLQQLGLTIDEIIQRIDPSIKAIGISILFSFTWPITRSLIHAIRKQFPDKIIFCGGEHVTALPEYCMETAPIDYIIMGEGEEVTTKLIAKLDSVTSFDPGEIPGICWRNEYSVIKNSRAPRIKNVDGLPWPAWHLFDLEVYNEHNLVTGSKMGKTIPILATRGCPYSCKFCSNPHMWGTRWVPRDPKDVVDEIEFYVKKYGAEHIPFQDLTPLMKQDWIVKFCNEIIKRGLQIKWEVVGGTRCEFITEDILQLLKQSGCNILYFAPETGSEEARKNINKHMKTKDLMRAIELTVKAGINLGVFLVLGFPDDTVKDLRDTVKMARKLARKGLIEIAPAFYFPIPASTFCNRLFQSGRIKIDDTLLMAPIFIHDKWMTDERNYCQNISSSELTFYKYWIVANFYIISWITHPKRIFSLIYNVITDQETCKMDTFLNETKRKFLRKLGLSGK